MKKLLVAAALALFATQASATIAGSPHDLSAANTLGNNYLLNTPQISACQFCHTPHNANTGLAGAPLWNRTAVTTMAAGDLYTSNTLNGTVSLGANSITCLSCHDGATDMGATFTGSPGFATSPTFMNTNFSDGSGIVAVANTTTANGLRDDHPVGIPMVTVSGFVDVTTAEGRGVVFYGITDTVECGSCHDPHGTWDDTSGGASFLRTTPGGLCAACHDK